MREKKEKKRGGKENEIVVILSEECESDHKAVSGPPPLMTRWRTRSPG